MSVDIFSLYSYSASAVAYLVLSAVILFWNKKNVYGFSLIIALILSFVWSYYSVRVIQSNDLYIQEIFPLETLKNVSWFFFLITHISKQHYNDQFFLIKNYWQIPFIFILALLFILLESHAELRYEFQQFIGFDIRLIVHFVFSIVGLVLIEQAYRNSNLDQRWTIKFLCLGLASLFTLDFILFSKSLLFNVLDTSIWEARGLVHALVVPLLFLSLNRLNKQESKILVSKNVIFHTTVLLGAGVYILLMALAGYYIKMYGGKWGNVAQIGFIFLAVILLIIFFTSGKIRALAKVHFSKNFFQHRYDYRDEWLKLSKMIAELSSLEDLSSFIVSTMADFVDSTGGGIWIKNEESNFYLAAEQNLSRNARTLISENEPLIQFLKAKQWVIDFVEYVNDPEIYDGSGLEQWYKELDKIWLIIPLFQKNNLEAFVVLTKPRVSRQIDWEDHDLLKTVGMQLANALALTQTSDDLSRSRQFEAYNRFSAFLVHDLKNLVAQVSLIVKNSEKHKHKPEFIDDSIDTLENVVKKIEHILSQLKKGDGRSKNKTKVSLAKAIKDVLIQQSHNLPKVTLHMESEDYLIKGEKEKLVAILGHLVQNAQEATDEAGSVIVNISSNHSDVKLEIIDTGTGMDEKFIQQRLFKPFDTTKGNAGMGIGVYEAKEYVLQQGGKISVQSKEKEGTTFTLVFPALLENL